jgi:hypothetical protein
VACALDTRPIALEEAIQSTGYDVLALPKSDPRGISLWLSGSDARGDVFTLMTVIDSGLSPWQTSDWEIIAAGGSFFYQERARPTHMDAPKHPDPVVVRGTQGWKVEVVNGEGKQNLRSISWFEEIGGTLYSLNITENAYLYDEAHTLALAESLIAVR